MELARARAADKAARDYTSILEPDEEAFASGSRPSVQEMEDDFM